MKVAMHITKNYLADPAYGAGFDTQVHACLTADFSLLKLRHVH